MRDAKTAGVRRSMARRMGSVTLVAALFGLAACQSTGETAETTGAAPAALRTDCVPVGRWVDPDGGALLNEQALLADLARSDVVLLGELHTEAEHHRWQLSTLTALQARRDDMVIGVEMLPRSAQPVLDRWVRGELDARSFLIEARWSEVWGFDPELYMPIFHFARMNRIPMIALNVDRALVSRVGREGWDAIAEADREGLSDPATPNDAYVETLAEVFGLHGGGAAPTMEDPRFRRFVEAQLTWDRAMAEAIADIRDRAGDPLVVGLVGMAHIQQGHGVPHQLDDLGVADVRILLPWDVNDGCGGFDAGVADAVFGLAYDEPLGTTPQLGVVLETADLGVRVEQVLDGSVAARAGVQAGDAIVQAAGLTVNTVTELTTIVQRQAPGTWLPLVVLRDGRRQGLVARFPANGAAGS